MNHTTATQTSWNTGHTTYFVTPTLKHCNQLFYIVGWLELTAFSTQIRLYCTSENTIHHTTHSYSFIKSTIHLQAEELTDLATHVGETRQILTDVIQYCSHKKRDTSSRALCEFLTPKNHQCPRDTWWDQSDPTEESVHVIQCTVDTVQCPLYIVQCPLYNDN